MILPVLHIACFKKFPNQLDESCVLDFGVNHVNKYMVVNVIKAAFDIALYEP